MVPAAPIVPAAPVVPAAPIVPAAPVLPAAAVEPAFSPSQTRQGMGVPARPDSVELLRKRTGTPQLGVPVVAEPASSSSSMPAAPAESSQAPVTGVIDPPRARSATGEPMAVSSRSKRPSVADSQNISHVWFEDEEDGPARSERARKTISPSVTDMALYDELPRRRRWGLIIGALAAVLGGGIALAMTLGGGGSSGKAPDQAAAAPAVTADAPPSTILDPPDAAVAEPATPDAAAPAPVAGRTDRKPGGTTPAATPGPGPGTGSRRTDDFSYIPPPDPGIRRPGGGTDSPPPTPPTPKDPPSRGVSGTDSPQDPYGTPDTPGVGGPEKQAEFFSSLGAQQLASGDTVNAAASFKKALELDARSVTATIGMGEIALRQGLFGDAIAHLQKASRLAPRNARIFVLIGESYLSLGRNPDAANAFKKALQLDPDNTRARDGYNEASSRVPPPTDE
jgi:hypothetical protein